MNTEKLTKAEQKAMAEYAAKIWKFSDAQIEMMKALEDIDKKREIEFKKAKSTF